MEFKDGLELIKDKKNGLLECSWQEMVEKLELEVHKDTLRKSLAVGKYSGYNIIEYYEDLLQKTQIGNNEQKLEELRVLKTEITKERKKLQATNISNNRKLTQESRFELFCENIAEAFNTLPVPIFEPLQSERHKEEYVLTFADIHYGAKFDSINNSYSIEECNRRFNKMLWKTVEIIKRDGVRKIKVLNNGDSIQGILRLSDLKLNEVAVVDAVVGVSKLIASFLNELSKYVLVEYVQVSAANHSQTRNLGSKASELVAEDLEKVIINYVKDSLSHNDRVVVHDTTSSDRIMFKIFDFECIAMHGHQLRSVKDSLRSLSQLHKKFFDFVFLGHTHAGQSMVVSESNINSEVIVVPSMVGSDPYSDSLMVGAKPMAQIHVFNEKEGRIEIKNLLLT